MATATVGKGRIMGRVNETSGNKLLLTIKRPEMVSNLDASDKNKGLIYARNNHTSNEIIIPLFVGANIEILFMGKKRKYVFSYLGGCRVTMIRLSTYRRNIYKTK